jgi:hypothetical protein
VAKPSEPAAKPAEPAAAKANGPVAAKPSDPEAFSLADVLGDAIGDAIDSIFVESAASAAGGGQPAAPTMSPAEAAAARATFEALAVEHLVQVRGLAAELRLGRASLAWVGPVVAEANTVRRMAEAMELTDLCGALEEMAAALEGARGAGAAEIEGTYAERAMAAFTKLAEALPGGLDADEGARRGSVIVHALLQLAPDVEPWDVERLSAAGLDRVDRLLMARADDLAATTGMPLERARRIVDVCQVYRGQASALMASPDRVEELRRLRPVVRELSEAQEAYTRAVDGWTDEDKVTRRRQRRRRELLFAHVRLALARLGELDRLAALERQPFERRVEELDKLLATPGAEGGLARAQ